MYTCNVLCIPGSKVYPPPLPIVRYLCLLRIGGDLIYFRGIQNYNGVKTKNIAVRNTWNFFSSLKRLSHAAWNLPETVRISVRGVVLSRHIGSAREMNSGNIFSVEKIKIPVDIHFLPDGLATIVWSLTLTVH